MQAAREADRADREVDVRAGGEGGPPAWPAVFEGFLKLLAFWGEVHCSHTNPNPNPNPNPSPNPNPNLDPNPDPNPTPNPDQVYCSHACERRFLEFSSGIPFAHWQRAVDDLNVDLQRAIEA